MPTNFFTSKLQGKRVVIVGGTSGVGFAVAQGCLEFGASVIVASSSQTRVDDAITRLRESGDASRITGYTVNLRGGAEGVKGVESHMSKFLLEQVREPFDHFVFTAGDNMTFGTVADIDLAKTADDMHVRYWAPFAACKISGIITIRPQKGFANAPGAGGLPTLAQLVSLEMAPIRCNVILLGPVRTELLERLGPGSEEWFKSIAARTTIGRIPSPHEPAEAYLYCMRDGSFTGQTIVTESGMLL